jgi:hypothetical protein
MAFRLGDYVVYGELRNTRNYSTFGFIVLRAEEESEETVIHLELTGDCEDDLKGKHFRFRPREGDPMSQVYDPEAHRGFQFRQIGPTGNMSAKEWVRTFDCPVEEFLRRSKLGEPPPTVWRRRLYLEWYSQNGRVVIEMADPILEECIREPKNDDDEGEWNPIPHLTLPPDLPGTERKPVLDVTIVDFEADEVEHITIEPSPDEDDDAFDTVPPNLQRELDREARAIDSVIQGRDSDEDEDLAEIGLIDRCYEEGKGKPIRSFLKDFDKLPRPETLDDEAVEGELKGLLVQLAMVNVAIHVCEHFTPRDCYRLLLDEILNDHDAFAEIIGTGWVQNYMTSEFCSQCEAQAEEDYRKYSEEKSE